MLYGKDMVQPYVVFRGQKGLKLIKQILNTPPLDPDYREQVLKELREDEKRILKMRAEKAEKGQN